jgi:hypothetical protein
VHLVLVLHANNYLKLIYQAADDKYTLAWKDGGTARVLQSAAYTADLECKSGP